MFSICKCFSGLTGSDYFEMSFLNTALWVIPFPKIHVMFICICQVFADDQWWKNPLDPSPCKESVHVNVTALYHIKEQVPSWPQLYGSWTHWLPRLDMIPFSLCFRPIMPLILPYVCLQMKVFFSSTDIQILFVVYIWNYDYCKLLE